MQKTLLAAFAAATLLSGGPLGERAEALTLAGPSAVGAAHAHPGVTLATNVCGINGCSPVHVSRVRHPKRGFTTLAVPMSVPTNSSQNSASTK